MDLHRYVVLGDDLLGRHVEDGGLHVDLDHVFADGVDEVEAGLEDLDVSAEGLVDADLGGGDLVDGAIAAAANTGTPDPHASREGPAALEAGLVASTFKFLPPEILEVLIFALHHLMLP